MKEIYKMLNPKQISKITQDAVKRMGEKEPSIAKLIKGTFLMQSGLSQLFDHTENFNKKRGLMLLSDRDSKHIFDEMRYNPTLRAKISNATNGIDLLDWDVESFVDELETNILLMIATTFCFYQFKNSDIPDDNLTSIGKFYVRYFLDSDSNEKIKEFVEKYRETFTH